MAKKQLNVNFNQSFLKTVDNKVICTGNYMFKRKVWDKFTEFTF